VAVVNAAASKHCVSYQVSRRWRAAGSYMPTATVGSRAARRLLSAASAATATAAAAASKHTQLGPSHAPLLLIVPSTP